MTPTPVRRRRLPWPLLLVGLTALGTATVLSGPTPPAAQAQSSLLDAVKRDPSRAKQLCQQLRQLNQQGISYTSKQATRQIASQENLSVMDAEVLTTYVVGLYCPDVR